MILRDRDIHEIIEKLHNLYNIFISNQFMKYYLLDSKISKKIWIDIEDLIESNKNYEAVGYELEKLYEQIQSFTSFLTKINKDILPKMKDEAQRRIAKMASDSRILYKMTLDNTPENLRLFYNLISDLFINVKRLDVTINGEQNALYKKLSYTQEIEKQLNLPSS